jgi:diguanylate cyclase (GGDEF)-like protein
VTPEGIRLLIHPEDLGGYDRALEAAVESRSPFTVQHRIVRPDGVVRTVTVRGGYMPARGGHGPRLMGTTQDVTGRPGYEERLWHLANQDSLTGLFNRRRFTEELSREVALARRTGSVGAVLILDLDRFKEVNDSLGHVAGDLLLTRVADALRGRLRATDTLARLGGDEFAVVLGACGQAEAERVAAQLGDAIQEGATTTIAGRQRTISASLGVAPFGTRDGETAEDLMVEADLAMYRAKAIGPGVIEVFDEEMRAELAARLQVEGELREAVEADQLRLYYQPIISLDGSPVGCEALVRWQHPRRGLVAPRDFISIAEEYGLIAPLGAWVLRRACRQAIQWRRAGHDVYVSVNISPLQVVHGDLIDVVSEALAASELPPSALCLELSESSLLEDAQRMLPTLEALKRIGVRLAIDDFGGGSAGFALLRMLPFDLIKIDRVFVEGLADRPDDRAIVAAVLSLADELDLTVIAEGVEDERQHTELHELGCRQAQGYLYARPRPAEQLSLDDHSLAVQPAAAETTQIREFMRRIGGPTALGA